MKKFLIVSVFILALGIMVTSAFSQDSDSDGIPDAQDNCPSTPNGPNLGTCTWIGLFGLVYGSGTNCTDNSTCTCDMDQGDFNGNGIGDVCFECYANINNDHYVSLFDLVKLKIEFGTRNCSTVPCEADITQDGKVGLQDEVIIKMEFGMTGCPTI